MLDLLAEAAAEHGEHAAEHATFLWWGAHGWVAIAMLIVIGGALWAGVPKIIAKILDDRIALIRQQLDEASKLRAEAEALRNDYASKIKGAEKVAAELLEHAQVEADAIVAKAEADSKALIERRKKMAQDKIAAAEREAVEELRATAARAAAVASRQLISEQHGADADRKLADDIIAGL